MTVALISERQKTHGDFADTARIAQKLKLFVAEQLVALKPHGITFEQRESLDLILTKIARIIVGDAAHADHWRDIAGYALLAIAYDPTVDSTGSYEAAVGEIGRRVKSGEEPPPTSGYFAPRSRIADGERLVPRR